MNKQLLLARGEPRRSPIIGAAQRSLAAPRFDLFTPFSAGLLFCNTPIALPPAQSRLASQAVRAPRWRAGSSRSPTTSSALNERLNQLKLAALEDEARGAAGNGSGGGAGGRAARPRRAPTHTTTMSSSAGPSAQLHRLRRRAHRLHRLQRRTRSARAREHRPSSPCAQGTAARARARRQANALERLLIYMSTAARAQSGDARRVPARRLGAALEAARLGNAGDGDAAHLGADRRALATLLGLEKCSSSASWRRATGGTTRRRRRRAPRRCARARAAAAAPASSAPAEDAVVKAC